MPKMTEKGNVLKLKRWQYLLLCASLFSNEVAVTFYLLYMVTWGQMLGLSTQVVTFPGVVSACFSLIVIPIMGKFGDKGNVHKRKSFLVLVSGALPVIGASCLIVACVVKLLGSSGAKLDANVDRNCHRQNKSAEIIGLLLNSSETAGDEGCTSMEGAPDKLDLTNNQSEHTVITATLAFIAFVLIDCGYGTGSSNIRGFVMECVDPSQHSKLLTIYGTSSGIIIIYYEPLPAHYTHNMVVSSQKIGVVMSGIGGCTLALMGLIEYNGLTGPFNDPALAKAIALSIFLIICSIVSNFTTLVFGRYVVNKRMVHHMNTPTKNEASTDGLEIAEHGIITNGSLLQQTQTQTISCKIQSYSEIFFQEISNIPIHFQSLLGSKKKILLLLSCVLCFFTSGSVMSFEVFFGNFLAREVYQGDWDAPVNTKAKDNFDQAMKTASLGAFLVQSMFLLYTLFHEKIRNVIGPLMQFFTVSFVNIVLVMSLALTKELSVFYVTALVGGLNMTLMFTTPFALAAETVHMNEYSETIQLLDENKGALKFHGDVHGGGDSSVYGSTISKVAMTIPIMYLLISAIMGPMLEATGNAASPMYFNVASSALSVGVVILIACVQRRGN